MQYQQTTFEQRIRRAFKKHPVNSSLILINTVMVVILLIMNRTIFGYFTTASLEALGGLKPSYILDNNQYYRLFTTMFLHGSLFHFLMNTYFLYVIGGFVEDLFGRNKYLIIYLVSGLGSSILIWVMYLLGFSQDIVTIGASGALFGLMGALLILTYKKPLLFNPHGIRSIRTLVMINVFITVFSTVLGGNISFFGHLGGFITGIGIIYLMLPNYGGPQFNQNRQKETHHGRYVIDADDVSDDDIYYTN